MRPGDRDVLLRLALGEHTLTYESRFKNIHTGETAKQLDLRIHDLGDWVAEERVTIVSSWEHVR